MLTIEYDPIKGVPVRDGEVEDWLQRIDGGVRHWTFSTENIFAAVRCAIAEGDLNYAAVQFKYGDLVFQANRFGAITHWPDGFCDQSIDYVERILKAAVARHSSERESKKKGAQA